MDIKAGTGTSLGSLPANFSLVLDRSGSMDGEKMDNLKEAVGYVADHLSDNDLVSVTIFDDQVETLIPNQQAKNRGEIKRQAREGHRPRRHADLGRAQGGNGRGQERDTQRTG